MTPAILTYISSFEIKAGIFIILIYNYIQDYL